MEQYILANFGGPRNLDEIEEFLCELLTDQDVVRSDLHPFFHRLLFRKIAKKRAPKVAKDYQKIGGRSPIFEDTEALAKALEEKLGSVVVPFHRYLPKTHPKFLAKVQSYGDVNWTVFPLFPQFSYATSGSCARFFADNLPKELPKKLRWIRSYASHPDFIRLHVNKIARFLEEREIPHQDCSLLFSAHGVPQKFIESGDLYAHECQRSFEEIMKQFPNCEGRLSYQSIFGKEVWLKPYTEEVCKDVKAWAKKHVVVIPISFTSDHIETLFEIEYLYLPLIRDQGFEAYRLDSLTIDQPWLETIEAILGRRDYVANQMLIRPPGCKTRCPACKKRCSR